MSRFLFIGAHPDDADVFFAGTAIQLVRRGHTVKFVSATNGDAGHFAMTREALAARRFQEAQKAAELIGLAEYEILNHHDGQLECNLANREEMIRLIRRFQPDVVISHWTGDYHADHRACGQLVMDCAYLLGVPLCCPDTPVPAVNPVFAYAYHRFTQPRHIRPDAAVEIDSVSEEKMKVLDCHVSQFYEWLPWCDMNLKNFDASSFTWEQKKEHLHFWFRLFEDAARLGAETLKAEYGDRPIRYAEVFEQTEYGRQVSAKEFQNLFLE